MLHMLITVYQSPTNFTENNRKAVAHTAICQLSVSIFFLIAYKSMITSITTVTIVWETSLSS